MPAFNAKRMGVAHQRSMAVNEMAVSRIISRLKAWQRRREAVLELSSYSDRDLRDVGIMRTDIRDAVKRA